MSIYSNHRSKNGSSQPICMMSDSHLLATINLFLREMKACINIINGFETMNLSSTERVLMQANTKMPESTIREANERLEYYSNKICSYVYEGFIRDNTRNTIVKNLQEFHGRSAAIPGGVSDQTPTLTAAEIEEQECGEEY